MKDPVDKDRAFRFVDHASHHLGRTELYLLLLLFVGGIAIDSWFHHHPQSFSQPTVEQPSAKPWLL